jgi:hypothetical protein
VEGQEQVCFDLLLQKFAQWSLLDSGIVLHQVVGGTRSTTFQSNFSTPSGGKDDVSTSIQFYNSLGINPVCLVDIDVLFDGASTVKSICKSITNLDLVLQGRYIRGSSTNYHNLKEWWNKNASSQNLCDDIKKLEDVGIFLFPGDFEALFTANYLNQFVNSSSKIIKEKFTYATKLNIERGDSADNGMITEEGKVYLKSLSEKLAGFAIKLRSIKEVVEPIQNVQVASESNNGSDDIPF